MEPRRNLRPIGILLLIFFALLLAGLMAAGGFWLGRSTAGSPEPAQEATAIVLAQEPEAVVEEAEATTVILPAGPGATEPEAATSVPQETPETGQPEAAPTEAASEEPDTDEAADQITVEEAASDQLLPLDRDSELSAADVEILFAEVWPLIAAQYDGELPPLEELRTALIRAALEELDDPFTSYTPPAAAALMRERMEGSFEGIGAFVQENEDGWTEIVRPMDGQPADLAGLRSGDVVIAVDGESVEGRSLDEVITLIRGPRGSEVLMTIQREGVEPFDVTIVRDRIEIPIVESEMLENDIAYVRLADFSRNAAEQLSLAVADLLAQNPQGLILDLRDNPGGYLDQAIQVSDLFLPEGVVLYERSRTYDIDEIYRSDTGDLAEQIPLVVLINVGSASASEIVAGAIRDNGRGLLVGETTFGKGSVQQPHTLSDGSELRVTIARWYIPSDVSIDQTGIAPDIEVATPEDLGGDEDPQLARAIEYILTGE